MAFKKKKPLAKAPEGVMGGGSKYQRPLDLKKIAKLSEKERKKKLKKK